MKHVIIAILTAYALASASMPGAAQTIKFGTLAPEGSPWHTILRDMAEAWRVASDGTIQFRIYAGGVAGDDPDMVRKMRIGQLHAGALTGAGLSAIAPEVQALQMPMMFRSYAELDYVRDRIAPQLESILADKGFKVLNWGEAGWVHFFTRQPVVRPEDLKPLKLFSWANDSIYIEAWREAGYDPIPLPVTEIHTALQSGLINAFSTTPLAALSFQWFGQAKHMTGLKWAPLIGATVISSRKWQQIPAAVQPKLMQIARATAVRLQQEGRRLNDEAINVMRKYGLVVHHVPSDVVAHWEQSARAAYPKLIGEVVPAEMVEKVEQFRNEYRSSHP